MRVAVPAGDLVERLERFGTTPTADPRPSMLVVDASDDPARVAAHRRLRARAFVAEQGLFSGSDADEHDEHPRTRVLVAVGAGGVVLGGVRVHAAGEEGPALGWWQGSRLVCGDGAIPRGRVGAALVRAACATALNEGALRFDAHVQARQVEFFGRLGWKPVREIDVRGHAHVLMRAPIDRIGQVAETTKSPLGVLVGGVLGDAGGTGLWLGDDGVPVPGSDVVACTDAITPSMVERDPEWAGWCGVLVCAHDLAAMGAAPVGALDALGAADAGHAERALAGLRRAAEAFSLPIMGGHTQLGVPGALSVTGLGRTAEPVPAGAARQGDELTVTADLHGSWRPGYTGRQWDSTTTRTREELRAMLDSVAVARPQAAKDVSMAGIVGTIGMLAEASGGGADLEVARIPRPPGTDGGDWLTCFPGFAMVTADCPGTPPLPAGPAEGAACGRLTARPGVRLVWPDGDVTTAIPGPVTGLGPAIEEKV